MVPFLDLLCRALIAPAGVVPLGGGWLPSLFRKESLLSGEVDVFFFFSGPLQF